MSRGGYLRPRELRALDANTGNEVFPSLVLTDVLSVCSSQKSFSLVLEALDYDNDTTETGTAALCVYVH